MPANYASAGLGVVGGIVGMIGDLTKDKRPVYQPVDLSSAAGEAQKFDLAQLPGAQSLASQVNTFNQAEVLKALNTAIPDYNKLMSEQKGVIEAQLGGEFAPGEQDAIARLGAAVGVSSGSPGSDFSKFSTLGLGFKSLEDRYNQGINSAQRWLQTAHAMTKAPLMDVTSMFISPMQAAEFTAKQHELAYESALGAWSDPNKLQLAGSDIAGIGGALSGASSGRDNPSPTTGGRGMGGSGDDPASDPNNLWTDPDTGVSHLIWE